MVAFVKAGDLRDRVLLQVASEVKNTLGEVVKGWTDGATVWAKVKPLSGRELMIAQQVIALATHEVIVRGRVAISPKDRISFGYPARILQIERVINPDGRGVATSMLCIELPS